MCDLRVYSREIDSSFLTPSQFQGDNYAFPDSVIISRWHFLVGCLSEIPQALNDDETINSTKLYTVICQPVSVTSIKLQGHSGVGKMKLKLAFS